MGEARADVSEKAGKAFRKDDICEIARIGLMFLDGDKLEEVLKDRYSTEQDDINYNSDIFNLMKITLMKIEKIYPELGLGTVLWQLRPDNSDMVVPVVIGSELRHGAEIVAPFPPVAPWEIQQVNKWMKAVFADGNASKVKWDDGTTSYYFAVRNSEDDITGVLELQKPAVL